MAKGGRPPPGRSLLLSRILIYAEVAAVTRDRDTYLVQWRGGQAIAALPEQVDVSNADQIREELLSVINRGAAALIADMTATLSCDHAGANALMRAYQRALVSGTQLRLVVTAPVVQRVLGINGLDRLIPIYPSLEAAAAADAERWEVQAGPRIGAVTPAVPDAADLPRAADQAYSVEELLDWIVSSIFDIGVILRAAADLPRDAAGIRITEALHCLDDVVREVRNHVFAERIQWAQSGVARRSTLDMREDLARTANRVASLKKGMVQTAQTLQVAAADTATLLERQADLAGEPGRIDYLTQLKRWRAFADQAGQIAKHWEQGRDPIPPPETGQGSA